MKSATSSLHDLLGQHPSIHMSAVKEPRIFIDENPSDSQWQDYLSLFTGANNFRYRGESSTDYTKRPKYVDVEARIYQFCPEARIIYIMRDPVERTLSHYWFDWRKQDERLPMGIAMRHPSNYVEFSHYSIQIRPYIDTFGPASVYTLTTESLASDPRTAMAGLLDWLGLREVLDPEAYQSERANALPTRLTVPARESVPARIVRSTTWKRRVRRWVPQTARRRLYDVLFRPFDPRSVDAEDVIRKIRPTLLDYTQELEVLLGRDFPEWTTLYDMSS